MSTEAYGIRRFRIVALTICFVVWSITFWIMFGANAGPRVMPGPLTSHHAALVRDCGQCHNEEVDAFKGLQSGISHSALAMKEGRRCVKCHDLGEHAFLAHSMGRDRLESYADVKSKPFVPSGIKGALTSIGVPMNDAGEIACAVCHREHDGREQDLKAVSDMACQSCHQDKDDEFPHNHSQFNNFPYAKGTRIFFDHASHQGKNFPEQNTKFECVLCHEPAPDGQMLVKPFENSCTSCHHHEEQIFGQGKVQTGLPILSAFGLDIETLADHELKISRWPSDGADFDEPPTALTWLLLESDEAYPERLNDRKLLEGVDLSDLSEANPSQILAVVRLTSAFRRLFNALAKNPNHLVSLIKGKRSTSPSTRMAPRLVPDGMLSLLNSKWFGSDEGDQKNSTTQSWGGGGRWYIDQQKQLLSYIPLAHDDAFVALLHERANFSDAESLRSELKSDDRCHKCHNLTGDSGQIDWGGKPRMPKEDFLHFRHEPHLLVSKTNGCATCHVIAEADSGDVVHDDCGQRNPKGSGFHAMKRGDCARCHAPEQDTNHCVDCHSYHIGFNPKASKDH